MEWIDIKERLPKDQQIVEVKLPFPFKPMCKFFKTEKGYFFYMASRFDDDFHEIYGVTHWMPLPETPEE